MENTPEADDAIRRWMSRYERAWASNDPDDIRALFTDDAEYRTAPWREPWRGADGIVAGWIEHGDDPGTYTFSWDLLDASPSRYLVHGHTAYLDGATTTARYSNLWIIELVADGRARAFTEWWMKEPVKS